MPRGKTLQNFEYLLLCMQIDQLRFNMAYRNAEVMRQSLGPQGAAIMARAPQKSIRYANIRLLVGTWNRIAVIASDFAPAQQRRFFKCHPILQTWKVLEPGITIIRNASKKTRAVTQPVHKDYAKDLENLAKVYHQWTLTKDGQEYRSEARQAVCADFG